MFTRTGSSPESYASWYTRVTLPMLLPAPAWSLIGEGRSYTRLEPTPRVGEHTREVLQVFGYDDAEIQRLYDLRIAHDFLPAMGSRDVYFHRQERVNS